MTKKELSLENTELLKDWMEMTDRVEKLEDAQIKLTGVIEFLYSKLEETHKEITRHSSFLVMSSPYIYYSLRLLISLFIPPICGIKSCM